MNPYYPGRNSLSCSIFIDNLNKYINSLFFNSMDENNLRDKAAFKNLEA